MSAQAFFAGARWLLTRVLVVLLVSLAGTTLVRQFIDPETGSPGREGERAEAPGPRIGMHWHATYEVFVCGQRQPNFPTWESGVHTHADGIIHIHPFVAFEEGRGARLVSWFEYGGGLLSQTEMRMPGTNEVLSNGQTCPDGNEARLQVSVNDDELSDWTEYIPQDGDDIVIVFGPEE